MPNDPQENAEGTIETSVGNLPAPTRAPEDAREAADAIQQPALSEEELRKRQEALGTRRKPAGPPLDDDGRRNAAADALDQPSDVPETDVTELIDSP